MIYLTSPGNPTGLLIPHAAVHALARALPDGLVFVDEAYADFTDAHFLGELRAAPNVVVGRTFAKAYGLAALRIGAVVGDEAVIARLRRSLPPYSINVAAAVALEAALGDQAHLDAYRAQVRASKARVYAVCDRLGLAYWPSEANFVLIRVGDRAAAIVDGAARAPHLRPRPLDRAGLRGLHPHHRRRPRPHRRVPGGPGGHPVRRGVIDRRTTETQIQLTHRSRGPRTL